MELRVVMLPMSKASGWLKASVSRNMELIEVTLPAVFTTQRGLNDPRRTSLKGIMSAKKKPQDVKSLADVGVDPGEAGEAGSRTTVLALADPPSRGDTEVIEDEGGSSAERILEFLMERKLV